jgi:hypothetical protein
MSSQHTTAKNKSARVTAVRTKVAVPVELLGALKRFNTHFYSEKLTKNRRDSTGLHVALVAPADGEMPA